MKTIKEQGNIEPEKTNKKRLLWISLSIGLVSIAIIVTIIVSLSLRNNSISTPTPNHEGVHYNNYSDIHRAQMVCYSVDIEKDNYDYNEEFTIKYTIVGYNRYDITDCNNLNFKIVSDEFEFLSPTEYHFDLDTDVSVYGNILSYGEEFDDSIYPIEMELKVKAKEPNGNIDRINIDNILFLYEYSLRDDYKKFLTDYCDKGENYKCSLDEFTKDFEWIHRFYYLNDDLGTFLVDDGKGFEYYDTTYKKIYSFPDYCATPYKSLNRLYEKELITQEEYLGRLIGYLNDYKIDTHIYIIGGELLMEKFQTIRPIWSIFLKIFEFTLNGDKSIWRYGKNTMDMYHH